MKKFIALAAITSSLGLTGCASNSSSAAKVAEPSVHPLDELRVLAVEARDELRLLAKIVDAKNAPTLTKDQHAQKQFQATFVPKGFERNATFAYVGPASKAAEAIAKVAGYEFKILGHRTPNEPFVSIKIDNLPLNEALKELGVQTGSAIRVEIHDRLMVLVYPPRNQ